LARSLDTSFLYYVTTLDAEGRLFRRSRLPIFDWRGGNASKQITRWKRGDMGLTYPLLEPDHSWRHRFTTVCGDIEIPDHRRKAIMGHSEPGPAGRNTAADGADEPAGRGGDYRTSHRCRVER
jgi:hypothetical protein